jgi:Fur family peroxide stress response transcriptional regulator
MSVSKIEIERRMRRFEEACRSHGLKLTHQRRQVFRALAATDQHPSAEALYNCVRRRVPTVSLDTIYRTLNTLEEKGIIQKAAVYCGKTRYDANVEQHFHFVCRECNAVIDVSCAATPGVTIPPEVRKLGTVCSCMVQIEGTCRKCRALKTADC